MSPTASKVPHIKLVTSNIRWTTFPGDKMTKFIDSPFGLSDLTPINKVTLGKGQSMIILFFHSCIHPPKLPQIGLRPPSFI